MALFYLFRIIFLAIWSHWAILGELETVESLKVDFLDELSYFRRFGDRIVILEDLEVEESF